MLGRTMPQPVPARSVVLASTSPHRRDLMQRLAVPVLAVDPNLDESPYKALGLRPADLVQQLSEAKARAVGSAHPEALIVGSDQCAEIDGRILGKPKTVEAARDQLSLLCGRGHRLLTGLCVLDSRTGRCQLHLDEHVLHMRPLTRAQIERYVERDRPMDCAGGYRIEASGMTLFEHIDGQDYTAVIGLPMMRLVTMLLQAGLDPL